MFQHKSDHVTPLLKTLIDFLYHSVKIKSSHRVLQITVKTCTQAPLFYRTVALSLILCCSYSSILVVSRTCQVCSYFEVIVLFLLPEMAFFHICMICSFTYTRYSNITISVRFYLPDLTKVTTLFHHFIDHCPVLILSP